MTYPAPTPGPATRCLCSTGHTTHVALASCLWSDADQIAGEGPYALVFAHNGKTTVIMWSFVDDALDAKLELDKTSRSLAPGSTNRVHLLQPAAVEVKA